MLRSWSSHFSLTGVRSTQDYKWEPGVTETLWGEGKILIVSCNASGDKRCACVCVCVSLRINADERLPHFKIEYRLNISVCSVDRFVQ